MRPGYSMCCPHVRNVNQGDWSSTLHDCVLRIMLCNLRKHEYITVEQRS